MAELENSGPFMMQVQRVREAGKTLNRCVDKSAPEARDDRMRLRQEIEALKPLAYTEGEREFIAQLENDARLQATYCACVHGDLGLQTFKAARSEPVASRLAFKFLAPDFANDAALDAYFIETFFPLRVVFDDATGQEHPSQGGFTDFAEARRLMGAVATVPVAEAYDERLGGNRRVQVRRARVVTKDGRTLEEREARVP